MAGLECHLWWPQGVWGGGDGDNPAPCKEQETPHSALQSPSAFVLCSAPHPSTSVPAAVTLGGFAAPPTHAHPLRLGRCCCWIHGCSGEDEVPWEQGRSPQELLGPPLTPSPLGRLPLLTIWHTAAPCPGHGGHIRTLSQPLDLSLPLGVPLPGDRPHCCSGGGVWHSGT